MQRVDYYGKGIETSTSSDALIRSTDGQKRMSDKNELTGVYHAEWSRIWTTGFVLRESVLYFGDWRSVHAEGVRRSNVQYNAFEFSFRGSTVRWFGTKAHDHGHADVFIDGEYRETVDSYSEVREKEVLIYENKNVIGDRIHTLRVVVKRSRNPKSTDCYQGVCTLYAEEPISYPGAITESMRLEYESIQDGSKPYLPPEEWSPVPNSVDAPFRGVTLGPGVLHEAFERHLEYLNHCFSTDTYCDGIGWTEWLPASNEGRMLAGAANMLRWKERPDMRAIVDRIVPAIKARMRDDGYYNYYDEADSFRLRTGGNSERKNYDRVFWTRGLLAAGAIDVTEAYGLVRRMYDWFNSSEDLPFMLVGCNATNGLPGGPLVYHSPIGVDEDLIVTERYYDQDYWMRELTMREPLSLSHYPGERPHCYDLLGLEAFLDQYRATGAAKYCDAALGFWQIYREHYKHPGGATAIMESEKVFPPKSYYFAGVQIGETCGSVFWININSKLHQLFPDDERYTSEIEESLYNVVLANQDSKGYIRYHSSLHEKKEKAACDNSCCEVSATDLIARIPELVYSIANDGIFVSLFSSSEIKWLLRDKEITLKAKTDFPIAPDVSITLSIPGSIYMNLRIRVPSWAVQNMMIEVNGEPVASGSPGSYRSIEREWSDGDTIEFELPLGFRAVKYTGLDQVEGNLDRYALMYGPLLMALVGELPDSDGVPRITTDPGDLVNRLRRKSEHRLDFGIDGFTDYRYSPYWGLESEPFTCYPIVEALGYEANC